MRSLTAAVLGLGMLPMPAFSNNDIILSPPSSASTAFQELSYDYALSAQLREKLKDNPSPFVRVLLGGMQLNRLLGDKKTGPLPVASSPESDEWQKILFKAQICFFHESDAAKREEIKSILQFVDESFISHLRQEPLNREPTSAQAALTIEGFDLLLSVYHEHYEIFSKAFAASLALKPDYTPTLEAVLDTLLKAFFAAPNGAEAESQLKSLGEIYNFLEQHDGADRQEAAVRAGAIIGIFKSAREIDRLLPQEIAQYRHEIGDLPLNLSDYVKVAIETVDFDNINGRDLKLMGILLELNEHLKKINGEEPEPEQAREKDLVLSWQARGGRSRV